MRVQEIHVLDGIQIPHRKGHFLVSRPIVTYIGMSALLPPWENVPVVGR